jgi:ELWxxDGT repeat protein
VVGAAHKALNSFTPLRTTRLTPAFAMATPRLVADISTGSYGSYPNSLTAVGDTLFFVADDGRGDELWKSDGTAAGTILVRVINTSGSSSYPRSLTAVGDTLFFTADDGSSGYELWTSDGTFAGTVRVTDIRPGGSSSFPSSLTVVGDTLFFRANDGISGTELWKSDGTAAGTVRVADIYPGGSSSFPSSLTAVGDTLFFTADDGSSGYKLWKSDSTSAGTVRVADIRLGGSSSSPSSLTAVGDTLFFSANDGISGTELWKSDGTAAGTVRVADLDPGGSSSYLRSLTAVGETLFFVANDGSSGYELWKSDGTAAGTVRVADIRKGYASSSPYSLTAVGDTLFFRANDDISGTELWALDLSPQNHELPDLAIAATDADKSESLSGTNSFTFTVIRSGDVSAGSSARWMVTGTDTNSANARDFAGNRLPSGTVRFQAGETSETISVNVLADLEQELDESFTVSLSQPIGATITTASAVGTIRNDDLIGTAAPNIIRGKDFAEFIDGRAGQDLLTGGKGSDVFGFRYRESTITASDRITDFRFGEDLVAIFNPKGKQQPLPRSLTRAADNRTATSLNDLAVAVFADADGRRRGNQPFGARSAALVKATNRAIKGTYLLINDTKASFNIRNDLLVNITGFKGVLPGIGSANPDFVFR